MLALVNWENSLATIPNRPDHLDYHYRTAFECFAYLSLVECLKFETDFVTDQLVDFVASQLIAVGENYMESKKNAKINF